MATLSRLLGSRPRQRKAERSTPQATEALARCDEHMLLDMSRVDCWVNVWDTETWALEPSRGEWCRVGVTSNRVTGYKGWRRRRLQLQV